MAKAMAFARHAALCFQVLRDPLGGGF